MDLLTQFQIKTRMIQSKIDALMISLMFVTSPNVLAFLASLVFIIYYLSMLKINVVNKAYNGSWMVFIKSWINCLKSKGKDCKEK